MGGFGFWRARVVIAYLPRADAMSCRGKGVPINKTRYSIMSAFIHRYNSCADRSSFQENPTEREEVDSYFSKDNCESSSPQREIVLLLTAHGIKTVRGEVD